MTAEPETVTTDQSSPTVSQRALSVGLCMTVVAIAFEAIAVATAMPVAARDLQGLPYYGWAFSMFLIGILFATVVAGRLSDRIGPGKPMIAGLLVFAAGLVVAGTAEHMAQLVAARFVQGLGSGVLNTAAFVIIAQAFDVTQRPRMFTYISTAWVVPSFLGPPIAAWLTNTLSWHWVFLAVLPLVAFGGAMVLPTLLRLVATFTPTQPRDRARPAPLWAAAVVAVAAAALQYAGQRLDWLAVGFLAAGLAGLLLGLPQLMPAGFLRLRRGLPAVLLVRCLLPGAFIGAEAFLPLMLVEQRGVALILAGATLTVGSVGWTAASWLQSQTWLPIGRDRLVTLGTLSVTIGIAICALAAWVPWLWFGLVGLGWLFAGFGMGLSTASTALVVMTLSRTAEQGRNASSLNLGDALGSGLFVGVSGSIFAALHPAGNEPATFGTVMVAMVVVAVLAVLASLRIGRVQNEV